MATSGTVSAHPYPIRKIMDHAFMRAGYEVQKITSEGMTIALDLLYSLCTDLINAGFPLWTRQYLLLGITPGSPNVIFPRGVVDVLQSYWRSFNPYRGVCTVSGGPNSTLFAAEDGPDVNTSFVSVDFTTVSILNTIGILLGGSVDVVTAFQVQTSEDGVTWTTSQLLPETTFTPGHWAYFDLDPSTQAQYVRVNYTGIGTIAINHMQFGLANGIDTPLGVENIDDYFTLPNKAQQSNRPVVAYVDRQITDGIDGPILKIWGVPDNSAFYAGTVTALTRRYIQDPGTLRDDLEIPRRWIECVQWTLAEKIMSEIPANILLADPPELTQLRLAERKQRLDLCERRAKEARMLAWSEERTKAPIRITPDISPYTR